MKSPPTLKLRHSVATRMEPDDPHPDAHERLAHLRGALRLTRNGVALAADIAQDMHRAIADAPLGLAAQVPAGRVARLAHDAIRDGVYAGVRGINRLLFGALDRALAHVGPALAPPAALPSPLVGLLHGVLGDHLASDRSLLRTDMHLRHRGRRLALTPGELAATFPDAGDRLVVFVHGLAADETCWRRGSQRAWGRPDLDYGALLAERRGVVPLYVRYNSGLRISDNGRALAALLHRLLAAYPVVPRALVLVGHSMGGLVVRSACHHGRRAGDAWTDRVTDIVCLGAPHRGAALEKFGAVAVTALHAVSFTAPIARAIDLRSAGIKDLRHGTARDDGGDEVALPHARYHDLAGTIGPAGHPIAWVLGDGLVRVASATPEGRHDVRRITLAGVHHIRMLNHRAILELLESLVQGAAPAR
jgi:pimeloyl-ACP methyl ester carboxylesterase